MGFEDRQYFRDDQNPRRALPGFQFGQQSIVLSLVVINVVIFLLDSFSSAIPVPPEFLEQYPETRPDGTHWLSRAMAIDTDHLWYFWTYLTHGFAHASLDTKTGIWHIAGNMITLWFLGRPVEHRLGRNEFLKFYLFSIVIAGIGWAALQLILNPQQPAFIVGASGAVSAVVVLFILMYPHEKILLMGVLPMPAWVLGVLLLVLNVFHALDPVSHIAWEAHLIGAVFGVLYFKLGWNFDRLQFGGLSKLFGPRSELRVHNPGAGDEKLQTDVDRILVKISEHGEESLSSKERKTLKKYSQRLRKNRDN